MSPRRRVGSGRLLRFLPKHHPYRQVPSLRSRRAPYLHVAVVRGGMMRHASAHAAGGAPPAIPAYSTIFGIDFRLRITGS